MTCICIYYNSINNTLYVFEIRKVITPQSICKYAATADNVSVAVCYKVKNLIKHNK